MNNNILNFIQISSKDNFAINELSKFASEIIKDYYDPIIGAKQNDYMINKFQSAESITNQIKSGVMYFVILNNNNKVGFFALDPTFKEKKELLFLSKLYIHKNNRKKGFASEAFKFILKKAHENNLNGIYLHVNRNNNQSISAYKCIGLKIAGENKTDIGNGFVMDDYIMEYLF